MKSSQQNGTLQTSTSWQAVYINWWLLQLLPHWKECSSWMQSLSLQIGRTDTCSPRHTWHHHLACQIDWDGLLGQWDTFSGKPQLHSVWWIYELSQTRYPEQSLLAVMYVCLPAYHWLPCTICEQHSVAYWHLIIMAFQAECNFPGWYSVVPWGSSRNFSCKPAMLSFDLGDSIRAAFAILFPDASAEPSPEWLVLWVKKWMVVPMSETTFGIQIYWSCPCVHSVLWWCWHYNSEESVL